MVPVVYAALDNLKIKDKVLIIQDSTPMKEIGLKLTPALEINGEIIYEGKYPGVEVMIETFRKYMQYM
ncbi:MAG: thioredoxin family protein [Acidaminobacteraceae bacterium]